MPAPSTKIFAIGPKSTRSGLRLGSGSGASLAPSVHGGTDSWPDGLTGSPGHLRLVPWHPLPEVHLALEASGLSVATAQVMAPPGNTIWDEQDE